MKTVDAVMFGWVLGVGAWTLAVVAGAWVWVLS